MQLTHKEFVSNREVKWCPGCGDYAILLALQKALAAIGRPPEEVVCVSGIGCAGRMPYYLNAFGFHTLHGRAPAAATGIRLMRDDLSIWVIIGDGDGLSIGLNHLVHALRRDLNLNILLINNQIYGLTKGQASPTSMPGQKTKTTQDGVFDESLNPLSIALSSGATFVARGVDKNPKQLTELFIEAERHQGTSFIEVYQNCNVFNDGVFDAFSDKTNRPLETINLKDGAPLVTEAEGENKKGLALKKLSYEVIQGDDVLQASTHDVSHKIKAKLLAELSHPAFPLPLGIFYQASMVKEDKSSLNFATLDKLKALF